MATKPRNRAPTRVMRRVFWVRYSAVRFPGRMPGIDAPCFLRFSAMFCC